MILAAIRLQSALNVKHIPQAQHCLQCVLLRRFLQSGSIYSQHLRADRAVHSVHHQQKERCFRASLSVKVSLEQKSSVASAQQDAQ